MTAPQVSVVIPSRNRAYWVPGAIDSALSQEDVEVQVVVIDDGSTDKTPDVLARISDPRVKVIARHSDHGEPQARNAGAALADYDLLAFLDDDDRWDPVKLRRQIDALESHDADWSVTGARHVDVNGHVLSIHSPERIQRAIDADQCLRLFLTTNQVPGPGSSLLVRHDVFDSVGGFDERVPLFADWDIYIRLAYHGDPAVVDEPLVDYTQHDGQMSRDLRGGWEALAGFRRRYGDLRAANDVRTADESVLWWIASRQLTHDGPVGVARQLWNAGVVTSPSDAARLARTLIGVAKERLAT